ncbi:MAG: response regulator [Candidatus Dormibacteria bacterium]
MSHVLLIAEDEPMIARILAEKLEREGYEIRLTRTAAGLRAGLGDCDVALVDATLDEDGVAVTAAAAQQPRAGWFAMLEQRHAGDGIRAVQAGAAGVILKPFKPTAVASQVQLLLAVARP